MNLIDSMGIKPEFVGVEAQKRSGRMFECNLINIDTSLPMIIAYILLNFYHYKIRNIAELTSELARRNPLKFDTTYHHTYYETKIKRLLVHIALGMTPTTLWNGKYQTNGGYLVVKSDGDIVCYHIYNKNEFEDYLFNNTKLEMPSRKRWDYGYVYCKGNQSYIKLNLQIRFIK